MQGLIFLCVCIKIIERGMNCGQLRYCVENFNSVKYNRMKLEIEYVKVEHVKIWFNPWFNEGRSDFRIQNGEDA